MLFPLHLFHGFSLFPTLGLWQHVASGSQKKFNKQMQLNCIELCPIIVVIIVIISRLNLLFFPWIVLFILGKLCLFSRLGPRDLWLAAF